MLKMGKLYELTVTEAIGKLNAGDITSVDLVQSCLDRMEEMEPTINAFITITGESALKKAREIDDARAAGKELGVLAGIPYSLKDSYVTKDVQTTSGSKVLEGFIPPYDATVVKRLEDAGAILLGKTNQDPFGFGSTTENSAYGVTCNPVDTDRVAGGSSGGSAASVRYGGGLFSIGEDTGGSSRCPASFCGVYGIKPTYGRISRYGVIAYGSSYDCVGPIGKSPEDIALVMEVISGKDDMDATTRDHPVGEYVKDVSSFDESSVKGMRVGLPKEYFGEGLDDEVRNVVMDSVDRLKELGAEVVDISLPYTEYAIAAYYVIGLSEASSNLNRMDGIRFGYNTEAEGWLEKMAKTRGEGFGDEEKRRIMIGTFTLSTGYADKYYKRAQRVRDLLKEDFARALTDVDVILTPTMPIVATKIGEFAQDPLQMWLADAYTVSVNPVGVPALSVPVGCNQDGLPVGVQLIGNYFDEGRLLGLGKILNN